MKASRRLRLVGVWFSDAAPSALPRPEALAGSAWDPEEKATVCRYLRSGHLYETSRGLSWCRLGCGVEDAAMGHREYTDGSFVWPEGLVHYVEAHDVELPRDLVDAALRADPTAAPPDARIDASWWIEWSRVRGATVDLSAPWAVIEDWEAQRSLSVRMQRELSPRHVLAGEGLWPVARRDDRGDVLVVIDGDPRLAVVELASSSTRRRSRGGPDTGFVDGWGAWNEARTRWG